MQISIVCKQFFIFVDELYLVRTSAAWSAAIFLINSQKKLPLKRFFYVWLDMEN